MLERLTPDYRFTCDRCGKVQESIGKPYLLESYPVSFHNGILMRIQGDVCKECYEEFLEFANNFFDEVNKTAEGGDE